MFLTRRSRTTRAAGPARRLSVECLEERTVPVLLTVNSTNDILESFTPGPDPIALGRRDDVLTLREALLVVNETLPVSQLTTLEQEQVTINSPVVNPITFDLPADDARRFYYRDDGVAGGVSLANQSLIPQVNGDPATDDDLRNPALVGAGNVSDPDHPYSWWSIQPTALLPAITQFVNIQGHTQPGSSRNTLSDGDNAVIRVELDGSQITESGPFVGRGLHFRDNNAGIVSGLAINGFSDSSGILAENSGIDIRGNFIGTDVSGTLAPQGLPDLSVVFSSTPYGIHIVGGFATIGGGTDPGDRNVIAASAAGVVLRGPGSYRVFGNFVGTDRTGTKSLGNRVGVGTVGMGSGSLVGGAQIGTDANGLFPLGRNVISGNRYGIVFNGTSDPGNDDGNHTVAGNFIGVGATGQPLGNVGTGIGVLTGASDIMIGGLDPAMGNVIAYNGNDPIPGVPDGPGIAITNFVEAPARISILGNSIHSNFGLGIDLFAAPNTVFPDGVTANDPGDSDAGPNGLQNAPVLTAAARANGETVVKGTLNSLPSTRFRLEFFADATGDPTGHGEGRTFLGAIAEVMTGGNGQYDFSQTGLSIPGAAPAGSVVSTTATRLVQSSSGTLVPGDTSEFSNSVAAQNSPPQAAGDTYSVVLDATLTIPAAGVLANDDDPDGDPLWVSDVNGSTAGVGTTVPTAHGTVTLNADGSFTYTPAAGYAGTDGFTYRASDGIEDSAATVSITVLPREVTVAGASGDVTLAAPEGTGLAAAAAVPNPSPADAPAGVQFPLGFLIFEVRGVAAGGATTVTLTYPAGVAVNTYYMYGPTPDATTPHWYEFLYDGVTGAVIDTAAHTITLHFVDGLRGDHDLSPNGVIVDPGTPALKIIQVQIDIKPGDSTNAVNVDSQGVIAVAILSSATFDAGLVYVGSVRFAGAAAVGWSLKDVNGDGRLDLVLNFRTQDTNLRVLYAQLLTDDLDADGVLDSNHQAASITLTGFTTTQQQFEGSDAIDLFLAGKALRDLLGRLATAGAI